MAQGVDRPFQTLERRRLRGLIGLVTDDRTIIGSIFRRQEPTMAAIKTIKIHPAIGIARLGNHPTEFFDGPQKPFEVKSPTGGYTKDGKIKRQAAVFRLFGYDANGNLVKEIKAADADIRWHVELANKKAFGREFDGDNASAPLRNPNVPPSQRHRLAIQPSSKFVDKTNPTAKFDDGKFTSWKPNGSSPVDINRVFLGELQMDTQGVLRVLGAKGRSETGHAQPLAALHDLDPATGSQPQIRLWRAPDHAGRPAPL